MSAFKYYTKAMDKLKERIEDRLRAINQQRGRLEVELKEINFQLEPRKMNEAADLWQASFDGLDAR